MSAGHSETHMRMTKPNNKEFEQIAFVMLAKLTSAGAIQIVHTVKIILALERHKDQLTPYADLRMNVTSVDPGNELSHGLTTYATAYDHNKQYYGHLINSHPNALSFIAVQRHNFCPDYSI